MERIRTQARTALKPLFETESEVTEFSRGLSTWFIGKRIHYAARVSSTNDLAQEAARNYAPHGTVFIADAQEAGRGRRGRKWEAPPCVGLLFSVLIRPEEMAAHAAGWIPLVAGMSCAQAIAIAPGLKKVSVKWPNDIVLPCADKPGWKKLGGVLCESSLPALSGGNPAYWDAAGVLPPKGRTTNAGQGYSIIGIGLNVLQSAGMLPEMVKAPATSLLIETKKRFDRRRLLARIFENLETNLEALQSNWGLLGLQERIGWAMRGWISDKTILFASPPDSAPVRSGAFVGLDEFGRLVVREGGSVNAYADAEIIGIC